jgi:DNA-binding beta-propeller fold protein YncE
MLLAACGGAAGGLTPTNSALMLGANRSILGMSTVPDSGHYPHSLGTARPLQSAAQDTIRRLRIKSNSCCTIAVDAALNRIYVSRTANPSGSNTTVVDGSSFSVVAIVRGFGGANNVDPTTHNVWLPGLYGGNVEVYSGITNSAVTTVSLGACPVGSWIDGKRRYAWVAAQCGNDHDPVWAINADTYAIAAGPIRTPGVMGPAIVNPVTGKFYVNKNSGGDFEINPVTFKASPTSFGVALGVDRLTDLLYAQAANGLNIVDGRSEKIKRTVTLSYAPGFMSVNPRLNHIYLSAGHNSIEVREGNNGALLKTLTLASGANVVSLGADYKRGRIYALATSDSYDYLYAIKDIY